ncbi:hypothetical protein C8Q77DRAFT_1074957 [Trametes polyzona]|nr:hypothetical protein C8Q77DRAFT_1074957 [Trametes polyzona]
MSPTLPLELVELILEYVAEPPYPAGILYHDYRACCLVCRAWLPKSQALLFRTLVFWRWRKDMLALYQHRPLFNVYQHILPLIKALELIVPYVHQGFQSICDLYLYVIAARLPALRAITLSGQTDPFRPHRFFISPHIRITTVTRLYIHTLYIKDISDFYLLVGPFPNLSHILLVDLFWQCPLPLASPRYLEKCKSLPLARRLDLAYGATTVDSSMGQQEDSLPAAITLIFQIFGYNLTQLDINMRVFDFLTSPRYNLQAFDVFRACPMPMLQQFNLYLRYPGRLRNRAEPYDVHMARIPTFLKAFSAKNLRVLGLYFTRKELRKSPERFLEHLGRMHLGLCEVVEGMHFPKLEKIRLDVAARPADHSWWKPLLVEHLPVLVNRGLVELVQFMQPHFMDFGPFTDYPDDVEWCEEHESKVDSRADLSAKPTAWLKRVEVCAYCDWLDRIRAGSVAGVLRGISVLDIAGSSSQSAQTFATALNKLFPHLHTLTLRCLRWSLMKEVDSVARIAAVQGSLSVQPCTHALKELTVYDADAQGARQCALVLRWLLCGTAQGTLATLTVDSTTLAALLHASAPAQSEPEVDRKHTKNARARPSTFALTQLSQCSVEVRVVPGVDRVAADRELADAFMMLRELTASTEAVVVNINIIVEDRGGKSSGGAASNLDAGRCRKHSDEMLRAPHITVIHSNPRIINQAGVEESVVVDNEAELVGGVMGGTSGYRPT